MGEQQRPVSALDRFRAKYPDLEADLEALTDDDRHKLEIRICYCGAMNEQWCCTDPRED
jgi:hypothetical protein